MPEVVLNPWVRSVHLNALASWVGIDDPSRAFFGLSTIQCEFLNFRQEDSVVNPGEKVDVGDLRIALFLNFRDYSGRSAVADHFKAAGVSGLSFEDIKTTGHAGAKQLTHSFTVSKTVRKTVLFIKSKAKLDVPLRAIYSVETAGGNLNVSSQVVRNGELKTSTKRSDLLKVFGGLDKFKEVVAEANKLLSEWLSYSFSRQDLVALRVSKIFGEDSLGKPFFDRMKWTDDCGFFRKNVSTEYLGGHTIEHVSYALVLVAETKSSLLVHDLKTASADLFSAIKNIAPNTASEFDAPLPIRDIVIKKKSDRRPGPVLGGGDPAPY